MNRREKQIVVRGGSWRDVNEMPVSPSCQGVLPTVFADDYTGLRTTLRAREPRTR